ncbi:MAG: beta-lactamase family protein [Deltaproteobacteria bacterium]|nr:beta-lactamase family protein [Deltaproteobacteria bacterium]
MLDRKFVAAHPEDVGVDSEKLEALFARAERDVNSGGLPSAQVAIARRGRLAGIRTFGSAVQDGRDQPATDATLYCIFSSTKAVVAAAVWLLLERGDLRLEEKVSSIIPEFGTNGKENITVEQVLLHIGGFPYAPLHPDNWNDRDKRLEAFSRWRLNWEPSSRFEYHPTSAHWVLAEIIHRRGGTDYREFIRAHITGPMQLDELFVGLPPEQDKRVADVRYTTPPVEPPGGWGDVTPDAILGFNNPKLRQVGIPGGGGITSAAELALFYQPLLNGGETFDGRRILRPETIDFATQVRTQAHHRDAIWDIPINRALSVIVSGDDGNSYLRGFGKATSPRAFGHGGAGGQIAWGDPATGISVGYCTNGFADWMATGRRITAISSLAATCAVA